MASPRYKSHSPPASTSFMDVPNLYRSRVKEVLTVTLHITGSTKRIPATTHRDNSHRILGVRVKKSGIIVINYNLNRKASNTGIELCIKASWSVVTISRICGVVNTNKLNQDSNSYQKTMCANPDMIY